MLYFSGLSVCVHSYLFNATFFYGNTNPCSRICIYVSLSRLSLRKTKELCKFVYEHCIIYSDVQWIRKQNENIVEYIDELNCLLCYYYFLNVNKCWTLSMFFMYICSLCSQLPELCSYCLSIVILFSYITRLVFGSIPWQYFTSKTFCFFFQNDKTVIKCLSFKEKQPNVLEIILRQEVNQYYQVKYFLFQT